MSTAPERTPAPVRASWTVRRTLLLVFGISAGIRLWCLATLPLLITNDGNEYLLSAERIFQGEGVELMPIRTPGYYLALAAVFHVFGVGPVGVLVFQHVLGCGTCVLLSYLASTRVGPRLALLPGLLAAVDPWLLSFESFALSEALTTALFVLAIAVAVVWKRPYLPAGLLLGIILGCGCLVRPAMEVLVPFFVLGWAWQAIPRWRQRVLGVAVVIVGVALPLIPWLRYNVGRGIYGLASGAGTMLWLTLAHLDSVDPNFPDDPEIRQAFAPLANRRAVIYFELIPFVDAIDGTYRRSPLLTAWAGAAIRNDPWHYARLCAYALGWQLNYRPPSSPIQYDDLAWYIERNAQSGDNFSISGEAGSIRRFHMCSSGGPPRAALGWFVAHQWPGFPQIPLFALAILTTLVALLRREWALGLVFAGTLAFVVAHALLLQQWGRYALPAWVAWYATIGLLPGLVIAGVRRPAPSSQARPAPTGPDLPAVATASPCGPTEGTDD